MSDPVIYGIRHVASGKVYVGSTNSWKRKASPETRAKMSASAKAARVRRAELTGQK